MLWPESIATDRPRLDWAGGVLSVGAVGGLVFGVIEGADRGWGSAVALAGLAAGVVGILLFVVNELRTPHPLLDVRLFRDHAFSSGVLAITVQFFAQLGFVYVGVQYLQFVAGFSALGAAVRLLPMAFIVIPASRLAGALESRIRPAHLAAGGLVLLGSGLYLLGLQKTSFDLGVFWLGLGVYALGVAFAATPATTTITRALPDEKQGVASAVNDTAREVGSAFGIAVLGAILTATYKARIAPVADRLTGHMAAVVNRGSRSPDGRITVSTLTSGTG